MTPRSSRTAPKPSSPRSPTTSGTASASRSRSRTSPTTHVGLLVRDVADLTTAPGAPELAPGQSLSGLLLASKGEIWVNASEGKQWPPRRRFTIGHELGHWRLHRKPGQQSLFCRKAERQRGRRRSAQPKRSNSPRSRTRPTSSPPPC